MKARRKKYRITTNGLFFRVERRFWFRWMPVRWYETCGCIKVARVTGYRGEIAYVYNALVNEEEPKWWRQLTPQEMGELQ